MSTDNPNENHETSLSRKLSVAVALLLFTLLGGWAAGKGGALPFRTTDGKFQASSGNVHFRGQLDRTKVMQNGDGVFGIELVIAADDVPTDRIARVPTDLVVVLDRSGSMQGKPLQDALAAIRELVSRLGVDDRFALVTYSSGGQLAIPLQGVNPRNRASWSSILDRIGPSGGTNMAVGIDLAANTVANAREAGRIPRIILLSDGHANEGDHSAAGLRARAARAVPGEYVLTTVGVGQGFDENLMTALADAGMGNFYYVRDGSDLGNVFAGEFDSARETVASAVTVEIDLDGGLEILEAAGYPVERQGQIARFRPGTLFAGQERHIWLSLRAPTSRVGDVELGEFRLTYRTPDAALNSEPRVLVLAELPTLACVADEREFVASLDKDLVVRGIVEEKLATLKQRVARKVQGGDYEAAKQEIVTYRKRNSEDYRRLGLVQVEQDSFREAEALEDQVKRAFEAPAAAPALNALSKTLAAEGQDGRRQGAKKQK